MSKAKKPKGFDKARKTAEEFLRDKDKTTHLLNAAIEKAEYSQSTLEKIWNDLQLLFRLVRAWLAGQYTIIPWQSVIFVVAAIVYFVNPFDLVPDFLPGSGFLDDATVVGFVLKSIKRDLEDFSLWEKSNSRAADKPTASEQ